MSIPLLLILIAACIVMLLVERSGARTTLHLTFKGDVKRETLFLQQWGQSVATPLAALLVWQLEVPARRNAAALAVLVAPAMGSAACFVLKRLLGRVRPNRENAGKFLGPSLKHDNARESFPSSHSACAVALSVALAHLYPNAALTFYALGVITALLRYVLDAHWPSDVIGGVALGYGCAYAALRIFHFA
jgi:membrane-associated phospholipid phosphatase